MTTQANRDSELQHSFGPQEIGFDYLPLDLAAAQGLDVPTSPRPALPILALNSSAPLDLSPAASQDNLPPAIVPRRAGQFWLDGDVLMCACPDCRAPMSVRVWLMIADCWNCGASIELTEEQEREALRLLGDRGGVLKAASPAPSETVSPPAPVIPRSTRFKEPANDAAPLVAPPPPAPATPITPSPETVQRVATPAEPAIAPAAPLAAPAPARLAREVVPPPAAGAAPRRRKRPASQPPPSDTFSRWLRDLVRDTPAWLVSLLVHLIAITLAALLTTEQKETKPPYILLSASVSREPTEGGDLIKIPPSERAKLDLPIPPKTNLQDPAVREVLLAAAQDARELRLSASEDASLPDLEQVKQLVGHPNGIRSVMAARDPRLRVEMVTKEGGTTLTEAAVARGLRWLEKHQNKDGSWGLNSFREAAGCNCGGEGAIAGKCAGTALALLPYLGAGQTHLLGKYKGTVSRGLKWLVKNQAKDGDLRAGVKDQSGMYAHGQAAIVLCEAFAMTGDEELRVPAQKGLDFIVNAQYDDGGWRYAPRDEVGRREIGDTSVVGWQLMALQSGRAAGLTVPENTLAYAQRFLDSVQQNKGAFYAYQPGGGPTPTMTAEALLCRLYLGWKKDNPALGKGVQWLVKEQLPSRHNPNIYYWYYATQMLHHFGGPEWEEWNLHMREVLVGSQETAGHVAGSWAPQGEHAGAGGRIYMTSLAICSLEVYYRHLPIFKQLELQEKGRQGKGR